MPGSALPGAFAGWPTSNPNGVPPVTPTPCLHMPTQTAPSGDLLLARGACVRHARELNISSPHNMHPWLPWRMRSCEAVLQLYRDTVHPAMQGVQLLLVSTSQLGFLAGMSSFTHLLVMKVAANRRQQHSTPRQPVNTPGHQLLISNNQRY